MKATTKWLASTGLILGLLVGCSNQPTVEEVGQAFNSLTEEEQAQVIEEYVAPVIEKALEDAFGEAILIEEENEEVLTDSVLNELVQSIVWVHSTDTWGTTTTVGILENTTDKTIAYIEIEHKFKKEGITVDSSWTNAINIAPGEKVEIEIITFEEFDSLEVAGSSGF
mgnify:CR=1 FL=1